MGPVELFYPLESIRQVTQQLILSGQYHVVRRQYAQSPTSRSAAVDHQRAGLSHQHITGRDANIADLQIIGDIAAIGEQGGTRQRGGGRVGQR